MWKKKITAADAVRLRRLHKQGFSLQALAEASGLSSSQVHRIVTGKEWEKAGGPVRASRRYVHLSETQKGAIRAEVATGRKRSAVARRYGITRQRVRLIVNEVKK